MQNKILVSGLINIETTVQIPSFPLEYTPICYPFFGINSAVSGVGMNICKALTTLGDTVNAVSIIGNDHNGETAVQSLRECGVNTDYISNTLQKTPQSVVLYDQSGKRQIHCDLKDVQEKSYDADLFQQAMEECSLLALCNINFSRPFLKTAKQQGKLIATDVHVLENIFDEYNSDFMRYADILFLSDENIHEPVERFVEKIAREYQNNLIVVGLGDKGALLYEKKVGTMVRFPVASTRPVVNTVGAGDALFSAFLHYYNQTHNAVVSLKKAIVFASYKIGTAGAAEGFATEEQVEVWYQKIEE